MSQARLQSDLVRLFRETALAHEAAFTQSDGVDPDWPIWYASYLQGPLGKLAKMRFEKSQLIYCLVDADYDHETSAPESDWAEFAASRFMECYARSETPAEDTLSLYYIPTCPFCIRVLMVLDRLDIKVELRNILSDHTYLDELVAARGRATVPVLRIESPGGTERWMPESRDIIDYLEKSYPAK